MLTRRAAPPHRLSPLRVAAARVAAARVALCALLAPALAACSFVVSTTGLFGGPADPPSAEGGVDGDALVDARGDGGAGAAFCASLSPPPSYCADFDDGRPLTDLGTLTGEADLSIDTTEALSGRASMLVAFGATGAGGKRAANVKKTFGGPTFTRYSVSVALRLDPATRASYTELVMLRFTAGPTVVGLLLAQNAGNVLLYEGHGATGTEASTQLMSVEYPAAARQWVTLRFEGTLGTASPTITLYGDGTKLRDAPLQFVPANGAAPKDVIYGVSFTGENQPAKKLNVDDVVVDFH
jgi:hypothetical protein